MNSIMFLSLIVYIVGLHLVSYSSLSEIDYSAEAARILKIKGIKTPNKQVKSLAKELAYAEKKIREEQDRAVIAEKDKANYEKVLRVIAMRSKLEDLVEKLYPLRYNNITQQWVFGKPQKSCCDALNEMLVSRDTRFVNNPFVMMLRERLTNKSVSVSDFMQFTRWLYNQFSNKACHKMSQFSPPLPEYNETEKIKEMLGWLQIDKDMMAITCVQVILQPLGMPPPPTTSTTLTSDTNSINTINTINTTYSLKGRGTEKSTNSLIHRQNLKVIVKA